MASFTTLIMSIFRFQNAESNSIITLFSNENPSFWMEAYLEVDRVGVNYMAFALSTPKGTVTITKSQV